MYFYTALPTLLGTIILGATAFTTQITPTPFQRNLLNHPKPQHGDQNGRVRTICFAGFGKKNDSVKTKGKGGKKGKPKQQSNAQIKKKLQLKERLKKEYGGDIAKGTSERIENAMTSLPPHIQSIAELYKKVARWDAYVASVPLEKQAQQILERDLEGAKRARAELDGMYEEYGVTEEDMHNTFQKITWDASADAKATNSIIGSMPAHIEERVERACGEIADAVKKAGRKNGRCLDVGCGHGTLVPTLTNKCGLLPNQIVGIDLSPEMIRNANEMYRGVQFIAADFLKEFEDGDGFDGIILCSALHDLPDMKASLAKAAELLRPGGKMVIVHAQGGMHVIGQHKSNPVMVKRGLPGGEELKEILSSHGLELTHSPAEPGSDEDEKDGYLAVAIKND